MNRLSKYGRRDIEPGTPGDMAYRCLVCHEVVRNGPLGYAGPHNCPKRFYAARQAAEDRIFDPQARFGFCQKLRDGFRILKGIT